MPQGDEMDRPVIDFEQPGQGAEISETHVTVKGSCRHWSGVRSLKIELDGRLVKTLSPPHAETDLSFSEALEIQKPGDHIVKISANGVRGAEAAEELRFTLVK
jgi:hypothetical protein